MKWGVHYPSAYSYESFERLHLPDSSTASPNKCITYGLRCKFIIQVNNTESKKSGIWKWLHKKNGLNINPTLMTWRKYKRHFIVNKSIICSILKFQCIFHYRKVESNYSVSQWRHYWHFGRDISSLILNNEGWFRSLDYLLTTKNTAIVNVTNKTGPTHFPNTLWRTQPWLRTIPLQHLCVLNANWNKKLFLP